ncbi:MAG: stage V sporulation protein SpoVM [Ruminococcus sp.]|nr:stage V sporulation protein SpoVM [Ruminococcus sp.]
MCTEVIIMKVILIENPKFISAILRKIYGIKKETQN